MDDNVIDATDRFNHSASSDGDRQKTTVLDVLRRTGRVPLTDRAFLAARLGAVAAKLNVNRPHREAKAWFDQAWQGDRWAKRKRLVILPGETPPNADNEGAYVASGGDWAALLERAAHAQHPGTGPTDSADRARAIRELLRGTSFLPALPPLPVHGDNAQALIASYADRLATLLDARSGLRRLWSVLATSPFKITIAKADGDFSSRTELEKVSRRARDVEPMSDHGIAMGWIRQFVPDHSGSDTRWADPTVTLGLRAHRRETRIFVVPENFMDDLPSVQDDYEDPGAEERVIEWMITKDLSKGTAWEDLPELSFDPVKGYGWRTFAYEAIQFVLIQVRAKPDGSPGVWVSAFMNDFAHYHPVLSGFDPVAAEPGHGRFMNFIGMSISKPAASNYEFVQWPTYSARHMPAGAMPYGAASGLVEPDTDDNPEVSGWLDDGGNLELQDLLFGTAKGVRFLPQVHVDRSTPAPCAPGTVAASLFDNLGVAEEDRLSQMLLDQATRTSNAGLAYHEAVVAHHRRLIDAIAQDQ